MIEASHDRRARRAVAFGSLETMSLTASAAALLAARAQYEVAFAVGTTAVAVRFSRPGAATIFADRFAELQTAREPDLRVYAVVSRGQAYLWRRPERVRCWPEDPADAVLASFADQAALHEYFATSADLGMHAAAIADAERAIALVGPSTAGKTTTALAAVREGFRLYSDERCILQNGRVVPFLRALTIRAGARTALLAGASVHSPIDVRLRAFTANAETVIRPGELVGDAAGGPALPLGAVFVIEGRGEVAAIRPGAAYSVLPALQRSALCREAGIDRAARLLAALRGIACYRLRLGSPGETVRAMTSVLG